MTVLFYNLKYIDVYIDKTCVEESEAPKVEEALKKVNYDLDDRASIWAKEEINKVINLMTIENAQNLILEYLPDPVGEKFAEAYGLNLDQQS